MFLRTALVSSKLAGLQAYQLSIRAPTPPPGSFDGAAAQRGYALFNGAAKCSACHTEPLRTESGWGMHTGAEIGIDEFQASRSPDRRYRTTSLRGLLAHQKGGFYHDGRSRRSWTWQTITTRPSRSALRTRRRVIWSNT